MNATVVSGMPRDNLSVKSPQLDDFCRFCLLRRPQLRPLTSQYDGVMIPEMLFKVSGTLLNILEQLPRAICERCLLKLGLAFHISNEFRKQEEVLRSFCWKGALVDQLVEYQAREESHQRPYSESVIDKLTVEQVVVQELFEEQFDSLIETEGSEAPTPVAESDEVFEMILDEDHVETVEGSESSDESSEPPLVIGETMPEDPPEATTFIAELLPSTMPLKAKWVEDDEEYMTSFLLGDDNPSRKRRRLDSSPSCKICEKRFYSSSALKRHLLTHTGAKPYKCSKCDKVFADPRTKNRHEAEHAGPQYNCPHCKKKFMQKSYMNTHSRNCGSSGRGLGRGLRGI